MIHIIFANNKKVKLSQHPEINVLNVTYSGLTCIYAVLTKYMATARYNEFFPFSHKTVVTVKPIHFSTLKKKRERPPGKKTPTH